MTCCRCLFGRSLYADYMYMPTYIGIGTYKLSTKILNVINFLRFFVLTCFKEILSLNEKVLNSRLRNWN